MSSEGTFQECYMKYRVDSLLEEDYVAEWKSAGKTRLSETWLAIHMLYNLATQYGKQLNKQKMYGLGSKVKITDKRALINRFEIVSGLLFIPLFWEYGFSVLHVCNVM